MDYKVLPEDYTISEDLDKNNESYIYGEVNPINIIEIIKNINYDNRTFLDIGSGCGKIIISIADKLNITSTGIEIDKNRFNKSLKIQEKYLHLGIDFINTDFRNIYLGSYDIIYCCNTIFSKNDNKLLYKKLMNEFKGYLLLFEYDFTLKKFLLDKKIIKTSWSKEVPIYIFNL